jgi:hypothetical protein
MLPETYRVVIPIKLEFSESVGFINKESVTMHSHTIVKYRLNGSKIIGTYVVTYFLLAPVYTQTFLKILISVDFCFRLFLKLKPTFITANYKPSIMNS